MPRRRYKPENRDWNELAAKALEDAKNMAPGKDRAEALKKAGQLQVAAEMMGLLSSKYLQPPK